MDSHFLAENRSSSYVFKRSMKEIDGGKSSVLTMSIADLRDEINRLPQKLQLPQFLPKENIQNQWTFCRILSQEIQTVLEKHFRIFEGEYLSPQLIAEVFYERVAYDDDADFDPSVFFQAVQVLRSHELFSWGKGKCRLVLQCRELKNSSNVQAVGMDKDKDVVALDRLAELMHSCVRPGDILVIFGDISLAHSKVLALNSRLQHPTVIAHYRHDGFVGPISPESRELEDVLGKCRDNRFRHVIHENGDKEFVLQVSANIPS